MPQPLFVGLDLGSSRIRFAMGQVSASTREHGSSFTIVGAVDVPSQGIAKGTVTALEDAVAAVSAGLEVAERQLGVPIDEAVVGIGGPHLSLVAAKGVVGVNRADGQIRSEDVDRVLESARGSVNPANHEILHVLSRGFTVDGQAGITDPVGMHGIRLEAAAQLVVGLAGNVRNMTRCVFRTRLDISSLVFGPLASAEAVTVPRERELGVCVVNIGAATTSVLVYEDGSLLHAAVIPLGADHVTSDIAIGLRTSLVAAEAVKLRHGHAVPDEVGKRDAIDLAEFGGDSGELIQVRDVAEIVEARVEELFEKVEQELRAVDRSGLLPAGAVLTGGGAKLPGMTDVAKRVLRLPASLGAATHVESPMPELAHDPAFSTAVGLAAYGYEEWRRGHEGGTGGGGGRKLFASGSAAMGKIGSLAKKVFGSFMP